MQAEIYFWSNFSNKFFPNLQGLLFLYFARIITNQVDLKVFSLRLPHLTTFHVKTRKWERETLLLDCVANC